MKLDEKVLDFQSVGLVIFILLAVLLCNISIFIKDKSTYKSEDLKININKADQITLEKIPYIGEKTASLIIEDRTIRGYYKNLDELKWVRNFEKIKDYLKLEDVNE